MPRRLAYFLLTIAGLALVAVGAGSFTNSRESVQIESANSTSLIPATSTLSVPAVDVATSSTVQTNAFIVRAVDGDTLVAKLDGEAEEATIRLLGINTPETVDPRRPVECFGKEASARMHAFVDGRRVRLNPDLQADERDKYGRLLRNVILEDGMDANAAMVRDGYAYAYLSFPLAPARKAELKKLENNARMARRGLWNPQTCNGSK